MEKIASVGLRVPASILEHFRLPDADGDDAVPSHNIGQALERYAADIATPLGPIARSIDVQMKSDPGADLAFFQCPILHPCALFWFLCDISAPFAMLIAEHCPGGVLDLVVWADEATSGNALRPDSSRKFMSVYWSVLQLPDHIRSQDWGWLPFAVISYNCLKAIEAELSGLLRRTLRTFFLDGVSNFASGFDVRLGRFGDRPWHKPQSISLLCAVALPCPMHPGQLGQAQFFFGVQLFQSSLINRAPWGSGRTFWGGGACGLCLSTRRVTGKLSALLQDEQAFRQALCVKGAAGTKCCLECRNILNVDPAKARCAREVAPPCRLPQDRPRPPQVYLNVLPPLCLDD